MKTPAKNPKKQGPGETHGSKATSADKKNNSSGKGPWKDPDPTNPKKSPEKVNEPYAGTNTSIGNKPKTKPSTDIKKEKITNAGESEHHIPVNKSDYENFEEEYEDFELDEEEDDFDEDEDGETSSNYSYEDEEDETRFFRSQVKQQPVNQKKQQGPNKLNQDIENKKKSNSINSAFNQKLNPQG